MPDGSSIFVSNGTCYLGRQDKSDPAMIPCGNDYFGHVACCQANDNCLESSVCFNGEFYVTYVAGCTDPEYQDASCPAKFDDGGEWWGHERLDFSLPRPTTDTRCQPCLTRTCAHTTDAPWLGMSWCDDDTDTWVLCDQHDHPGTIVSPGPCACPTASAKRTMTLSQLSRINNVASLPSATGLSIAFEPGYYPSLTVPRTTGTAAPPSASTSQSAAGGGGTVTSGAATSGASALLPAPTATTTDKKSASHLSTGATVGTAVGAAAFGILAIAGVGWLIHRRRRAKQQRGLEYVNSTNNNNSNNDSGSEEKSSSSSPPPPPPGVIPVPPTNHYNDNSNNNRYFEDANSIGLAYGGSNGYGAGDVACWSSPRPSELDGKTARPWSLVSELDGGGSMVPRPASGMEAIMEQDRGKSYHDNEHHMGAGGNGEQARGQREADVGPSELPADSIAELPA